MSTIVPTFVFGTSLLAVVDGYWFVFRENEGFHTEPAVRSGSIAGRRTGRKERSCPKDPVLATPYRLPSPCLLLQQRRYPPDGSEVAC